jgi:hypothetical protein
MTRRGFFYLPLQPSLGLQEEGVVISCSVVMISLFGFVAITSCINHLFTPSPLTALPEAGEGKYYRHSEGLTIFTFLKLSALLISRFSNQADLSGTDHRSCYEEALLSK